MVDVEDVGQRPECAGEEEEEVLGVEVEGWGVVEGVDGVEGEGHGGFGEGLGGGGWEWKMIDAVRMMRCGLLSSRCETQEIFDFPSCQSPLETFLNYLKTISSKAVRVQRIFNVGRLRTNPITESAEGSLFPRWIRPRNPTCSMRNGQNYDQLAFDMN